MRNMTDTMHRRDHDRVKQDADKIYLAPTLTEEREAFRHFQRNWQDVYKQVVKSLDKDLPDLFNLYAFCKHLWKKLRTTNAIKLYFEEVRRCTRTIMVFSSVYNVDRIQAIFHRFNEDWQNRTLELLTLAA